MMNSNFVSSDNYLDDLNSHLRSRRGVRASPSEHFSPSPSAGPSSSYRLSPSIHHQSHNVHYQHHLHHHSQHHNPSGGGGDIESSSDAASSTLINLVNLVTENVIVHPFLVARRQCQVTRISGNYHLTPFTVIPYIYKLQLRQGLGTLWRGLVSSLMAKGLFMFCRSGFAGALDCHENLLVEGLAVIAITPFFSSSAIELVQSPVASETPNVVEFLREGLTRWSQWSNTGSRLLPVWILFGPTATYFLLHRMISSSVNYVYQWCLFKENDSKPIAGYRETASKILSDLTAEVVLYPLTTVIFRLYLQGTRTIGDSIDTGNTVLPIISNYEGAADCFNAIIREEGLAGAYKGFGSLVLQYSVHFAIICLTKSILKKILSGLR